VEELGARIGWDGKRRLLWPIEDTLIDDLKKYKDSGWLCLKI